MKKKIINILPILLTVIIVIIHLYNYITIEKSFMDENNVEIELPESTTKLFHMPSDTAGYAYVYEYTPYTINELEYKSWLNKIDEDEVEYLTTVYKKIYEYYDENAKKILDEAFDYKSIINKDNYYAILGIDQPGKFKKLVIVDDVSAKMYYFSFFLHID